MDREQQIKKTKEENSITDEKAIIELYSIAGAIVFTGLALVATVSLLIVSYFVVNIVRTVLFVLGWLLIFFASVFITRNIIVGVMSSVLIATSLMYPLLGISPIDMGRIFSQYGILLVMICIGVGPMVGFVLGRATGKFFPSSRLTKLLSRPIVPKDPKSVRVKAIKELGEIKNYTTVKTLLTCLKDKDSLIRLTAIESLRQITNQDFGENLAEWQKWYDENKEKLGGERK